MGDITGDSLLNVVGLLFGMKPLFHLHQPTGLSDVVGQDVAVEQLRKFAVTFKTLKNNAAFLYGPSGSGKTCSVYALAADLGIEVVEINASDYRNKKEIESRVGAAIGQQSLFYKGKIVLVDEVDGLSGFKDRGGIQALTKLIEGSAFPIVLTATNPFDNKFSKLRSRSNMIQFDGLSHTDVYAILKGICDKEGISYEEMALKSIARRAGGDARAAINDLQILSGDKKIGKSDLEVLGDRNRMDTMLSALLRVFKATDLAIALPAFDSVDEDYDKIMLWLDENLPYEYTNPADLASAYDKLSRADVFKGRIRRWQHWRYLVYAHALISGGVAVSKDAKYSHMVKYKPTGRLLKIYWSNIKNAKKKTISQKFASRMHTSSKHIRGDLPFFQHIFRKNKEMASAISDELGLDTDEVKWMNK